MKRKKLGLIILCFIMLFSLNAYAKKPSKATVKKAYKKYIAENFSNLKGYGGSKACYLDMNNDGIPELFYCYERMSATRPLWKICTYKNGKVRETHTGSLYGFIQYNKKKKRIVLIGRPPMGSKETIYKLSGSKLKRVAEYICYDLGGVHYLKNGKEMNKKQIRKYEKARNKYIKWKSLNYS